MESNDDISAYEGAKESLTELYDIYTDREEILAGLDEKDKSYYAAYISTTLAFAVFPTSRAKTVNAVKSREIARPCPLPTSVENAIGVASDCNRDVLGEIKEVKKRKDDAKKKKVSIPGDYKKQITGKMNHVMKPEISNGTNGGYGGLHSLNEYPKDKYSIEMKGTFLDKKNKPYRAEVLVEGPDGNLHSKKGKSTTTSFFPDSWDRKRIQEEVEFAMENNKGLLDPDSPTDGIWGLSKSDPKFQIQIQMDPNTGKLSSFFPIFRNDLK